MNLLFLRGQVPKDRDPKQIIFDNLESCDDVWTQLACQLSKNGHGQIVYWGGSRTKKYTSNFTETWTPHLETFKPNFKPDVIFARGGFKEYDILLKKYPKAFKIYYGAGKRTYPTTSFTDYQLILNDTQQQLELTKTKFPKTPIYLFIKPAADNIFKPNQIIDDGIESRDCIFVANYNADEKKGHSFVFENLPKNIKMFHIGLIDKKTNKNKIEQKYPNIFFTDWIKRKKIPNYYAKSKVAIIACNNIDSCPRVIPEALACNCSILCLDTVNIWKEKYITKETGIICSKNNFVEKLQWMIENYTEFSPAKYYQNNLNISVATNYLIELINKS